MITIKIIKLAKLLTAYGVPCHCANMCKLILDGENKETNKKQEKKKMKKEIRGQG